MGRNIVSVIGREVAKASALSLQSLGTCSSFQTEKLPKCCFTLETYFAIWGVSGFEFFVDLPND